MIVLIRDGLHLSYGHFETKSVLSHYEIERCYNIFGECLTTERPVTRQFRVLRNGDGITTFKSQNEMDKFLSQIGPHKIYCVDLIHRKFYADRDTLLALSEQ